MPTIPMLIPPEPNELMISYLLRLANHNGLHHLSDFAHEYFWPNAELGLYQRQNVRLDANNTFVPFYKAIDLPIDKVRFYLDHTIYAGIAPLMTVGNQSQSIAHAFHSEGSMQSFSSGLKNAFDSLKICPKCMEEEIKAKGFWYYHREHQMPGVEVCAKHCTILQKLSRKRKSSASSNLRLFFEDNRFLPLDVSDSNWAFKYACFTNILLQEEIDTNVVEVNAVILQRLKEYDLYDNLDSLRQIASREGCNVLLNMDLEKTVKFSLHSSNTIARDQLLSLLVLLFENVQDFVSAIQKIPPNIELLQKFSNLIGNQYQVVGQFYKPLLEMVAKSTGEHFLTTANGFIAGWRENSADHNKAAPTKYKEMFEAVTDGTYHLLTDYRGMTKRISILHDTCQKQYSTTARNFLLDGRRCTCERSYTLEEAKRIVSRHRGFELVEYSIGKYKPCKIYHEHCGSVFTTTLAAFMKTPLCRRCETIKDHSEQNIKQLVADLVGDEYTVITTEGYAKGRIILRHNVCGRERSYISRTFTEGARCPHCRNYAKQEGFRQYVTEVSGGKYKIGAESQTSGQRFEIINTITNETKVLTRSMILQELTRPTPSVILPLENKYPSRAMMTHQDIILEYLYAHYGPDDFICFPEIRHIDGVPDASLLAEFTLLVKRKQKLFRVYKGRPSLYAFKDVKLTAEECVSLLLIQRNGVRFGFYRSVTLAQKLGIVSNATKTLYIASNRTTEAQKGGQKTLLAGLPVRLSGTPVLINEFNYTTLQFIDLCISMDTYGWVNATSKIIQFAYDNGVTLESVENYIRFYSVTEQIAVQKVLKEMIS